MIQTGVPLTLVRQLEPKLLTDVGPAGDRSGAGSGSVLAEPALSGAETRLTAHYAGRVSMEGRRGVAVPESSGHLV
jgi:hypothetical protein